MNTYKKVYVIIVIILSLFIVIYFKILIKNKNIISLIDNKYNNNELNIKDLVLYTSLNKIIPYDDIKYDIESIIKPLNVVNIKETEPIVYIYNTHESEKYKLNGVYDYSVTPDVKIASFILKDHLNDLGIESYVQTKSISSYLKKYNLDYPGSYEASRVYMKEEMKNHNYKILIDIHRDSTNYKGTLYEKNNKKYARIMFVLTTKHKNYKENEKFVNYLNNKLNKEYKGLSRGIMRRKDVIFNQDMSNNAILIEVGGVDNDIEEVNNTLEVFAKILKDYIEENKL